MSTNNSWKPAAPLEVLQERAHVLRDIRGYFQTGDVLEVETPQLSSAGTTDPAVESFTSRYSGPLLGHQHALYLHTSPEFPMKRLLAAGSGAIYQICKVFRQGEYGRFHNPEFTLLEWYRPGFDHHRLMDDVAALVENVIPGKKSVRLSYRALFEQFLGFDPHIANVDQLQAVALEQGIEGAVDLEMAGVDGWLDLLLTHLIEPKMPEGCCFVYDYPASQASLARVRPGSPPVAERFELYIDGIEVANGFNELTDAAEQKKRFEAEDEARRQLGLCQIPIDSHLLQALEHGLPACAGVALGIDRLLMLRVGAKKLEEVFAFPLGNA